MGDTGGAFRDQQLTTRLRILNLILRQSGGLEVFQKIME